MLGGSSNLAPPEEPPSNSLPINSTILNRAITLVAIFLIEHIFRRFRKILYLPFGLCIKYGDNVDLSEAASMEFIRKHTSVPVPKVYWAFEHRGQTYIAMERIRGQKLATGWLDRSDDSKAILLKQLKSMVEEIRMVKSPHGSRVASVDCGSLSDKRLPGLGVTYPVPTAKRFGPFNDIPAFHRWLRRPVETVEDTNIPEIAKLVTTHENKDWGWPVFTHGDLSSLNILIQDEKIVGIVDWETAGWYPYYWEYTTASQVNMRNLFWAAYIDRFLIPSPEELELERIRQKYYGGN